MTPIHHLNNTKTPNYPHQRPLNIQCLRHVLRIVSALRKAPKEIRLKLTGLARCFALRRLKAAAEYVHSHIRKAGYHRAFSRATGWQPLSKANWIDGQNRATSAGWQPLSEAKWMDDYQRQLPLYLSRECSIFIENIRQINLFLQNKPNFKKVKLNLKTYMTITYAKMDTW